MERPLSVHPNSISALRAIFAIHFPTAQSVLDPTYGNGTFWKWPHGLTVIGGDTDPARSRDYVGDCRHLPFADNSVDVVVIDPPFLGGGHSGIIKTRYARVDSGVKKHSITTLPTLYREAMREAWPVARQGLIVKCQDGVETSRFHMIHYAIIKGARDIGLPLPADMALIVRTHVLTDPRWRKVEHLRSAHSYFFVWRKP